MKHFFENIYYADFYSEKILQICKPKFIIFTFLLSNFTEFNSDL